MNEPLKAGDLCEVVGGLTREKSPNLGLQVTIDSSIGEHSQHGRMYRCSGPGVCQMNDAGSFVTTGWADFAGIWLKKIEPPTSVKNETREIETV